MSTNATATPAEPPCHRAVTKQERQVHHPLHHHAICLPTSGCRFKFKDAKNTKRHKKQFHVQSKTANKHVKDDKVNSKPEMQNHSLSRLAVGLLSFRHFVRILAWSTVYLAATSMATDLLANRSQGHQTHRVEEWDEVVLRQKRMTV